MSLRWCVVLGGLFLGCDDSGGGLTPEAEVEVVDADDVDETVEDVVDTAEPDGDFDLGPEADTGADTVQDVGGCAGGCAPGMVCVEAECVCDTRPASFSQDIAPRFATGCGPGCHVYSNVNAGSSGLNLALAHAYNELVEAPVEQCLDQRLRVVPGDPARSYLVQKMLGVDMCDGVRMPKGRLAWSAADMATLGRWICQGALDN